MSDFEKNDVVIPLGGIIGIAVVVVALIVVIIVILYLLCTRHVMKKPDSGDHGEREKEIMYAQVGDKSENQTESSHYAKVEFKKSDKFKQQKMKNSKSPEKEEGPVYAEIQAMSGTSQPNPQADSPEPRYANINIQSSV